MIYFIFWGILYLGAIVDSGTEKKLKPNNSFIFYTIIFLYFLILAGFRYKTGYDWQNYMPYFESVNNPGRFKKMELGYKLINLFFKNVFNSFSLMIFIVALFCTISIFNFCKLHSKYPLFSLFIYGTTFFLSYNLGLYRQSIAMAFSLFTIHFLMKKKKILAIVFAILAFLFHSSSIITILYFLCPIIHFSKPQKVILLLVSVFLNLFGMSIIYSIIKFLFSLSFLPVSIGKYGRYFATHWAKQTQYSTGLGLILRTVFLLIIFVFNKDDSEETNIIMNLVIIGCFIKAFGRNIGIISRLSHYYTMFEMIFYTYLIDIIKRYFKTSLRMNVIILFLLYFFMTPRSLYLGDAADGKPTWTYFYPWHSTIFKIEDSNRILRMEGR